MGTVKNQSQGIVIKSVSTSTPLYGGAWKVAYADFVTAMMAFFLLLWLLNVTTAEERDAISNYFDPTHPKVSESQSGAGGVLGGLSVSVEGAMSNNMQQLTVRPTHTAPNSTVKNPRTQKETTKNNVKKALQKKEQSDFKNTQEKIRQAIENDPNLKELSKNILLDMTPEGLRIQIVDEEGRPMFAIGSAKMFDYTRDLMTKIADAINAMTNDISVRGHTDSVPYGKGAKYTNWELSSDRANASRRVLLEAGTDINRLNNVMGKADTEHLIPEEPTSARNRRISIILLKEELTNPEYDEKVEELSEDEEFLEENNIKVDAPKNNGFPPPQPIGTFQRTQGAVQFP